MLTENLIVIESRKTKQESTFYYCLYGQFCYIVAFIPTIRAFFGLFGSGSSISLCIQLVVGLPDSLQRMWGSEMKFGPI